MSLRRKISFLTLTVTLITLACQTATRILDQAPATLAPPSTSVPTLPPGASPLPPTPTPTLVPIDQQLQLRVFDDLWTAINEDYLYEDFNGLDWDTIYDEYHQMIEAGLSTEDFYYYLEDLIFNLGDEHSVYLNPQYVAMEEAEYERGSDYVGIGIWVEIVPDRERAVVLLTFPGSPAEQAGILSHDSILSVDGYPILTPERDNLELLLGTAGSPVTLTVQSPGEEPRQLTVYRDRVSGSLPVINFLLTTPNGKNIGYLLIPTFSEEGIADQVGEVLNDLGDNYEIDGLILDNRLNSGGYDNVMADTLSYFTNGVVGHFTNRSGKEPLRIRRRNINDSVNLPLVVLVGEGTASFGEIFSGILQDQGRAALIGDTTLGNVEILWGYDFDDGSRAWIAHDTFIPIRNQDANWEETGLIPRIQVSAPWDLYTFETDPAILAALDYFDSN
jgi:C-terminal peptidase prc